MSPGDFVMMMGYPGLTFRSLTAPEMAERRDRFFTRRMDLLGEWIRILEESTSGIPEGEIAVAANLKSMRNAHKNAQGQLAGFKRGRLLEKHEAAEQSVVRWASGEPKYREALAAHQGLKQLVEEQLKTWEHDYLLSMISMGAKSLYFATTIVRAAFARQKPDMERDPMFMERQLPRLRDQLEREQKNYFEPADKKLLESFVKRALALSPNERIASLDRMFRGDLKSKVTQLYERTRVLDLAERLQMFTESPEQLRARRDPLIDLALDLYTEQELLRERRDRWAGAVSRLRPVWRAAVIAHAAKPVAPDANGTLRVSIAHVKGYEPRDGVLYKPQTTLAGMIEKYTGNAPFDVPADVLKTAEARDFGAWADERLADVPIGFLADADTTGGNSGSPVVNGRGELVGVNFDRVWENVANDFGYNPAEARNVNVDIRYFPWMLDRVKHGKWLLMELGLQSNQ